LSENIRERIPVSTTNEIPGYQITDYIGDVFGNVVLSRGPFSQLGSILKTFIGGELVGMTYLLDEGRFTAIYKMVEEAEERDANAVIGMHFEVEVMGALFGFYNWTEVCAYGTAVRARRLP